jgi:hypothetical protein
MLNEELERQAFEAWVNDENGNDKAIKRGAGDSYELMQTHLYWLAWKARAELNVAKDISSKNPLTSITTKMFNSTDSTNTADFDSMVAAIDLRFKSLND